MAKTLNQSTNKSPKTSEKVFLNGLKEFMNTK